MAAAASQADLRHEIVSPGFSIRLQIVVEKQPGSRASEKRLSFLTDGEGDKYEIHA